MLLVLKWCSGGETRVTCSCNLQRKGPVTCRKNLCFPLVSSSAFLDLYCRVCNLNSSLFDCYVGTFIFLSSCVGPLWLRGKINEEGSICLGQPLSWALLAARMTTLVVLALRAVYSDKPGSVVSSVLLLKRSQMLLVHEKENKKSFRMSQ